MPLLASEADGVQIVGLLCVRDERLRDAFASDEIELLRGLGGQLAIAVKNSKLYDRMKERDRLAALGEMAAGLAHEIRNPLGAIKGAAQLLTPATDPVRIIEPPSFSSGSAFCTVNKVPLTLTLKTLSNCVSLTRSTVASSPTPALATRTSKRPRAATAS